MEITRPLDAALRKAGAVWVAPTGRRPRLVWTLWRDGGFWVAVGGGEQDVPGLTDGASCTVTVRSSTTHAHLLDVPVVAALVDPDDGTASALAAARHNAQPRWTQVYRLTPTG